MRKKLIKIALFAGLLAAPNAQAAEGPFGLLFGSAPSEITLKEFQPSTKLFSSRTGCGFEHVKHASADSAMNALQDAFSKLEVRHYEANQTPEKTDICGIFLDSRMIAVFVGYQQIRAIHHGVAQKLTENYGEPTLSITNVITRQWSSDILKATMVVPTIVLPPIRTKETLNERDSQEAKSYLLYYASDSLSSLNAIAKSESEKRRAAAQQREYWEKERRKLELQKRLNGF